MQVKKTGTRAFTFIELLVALAIFSVIAASIYYTLGGGIRVYRRGNTLIRDNQRLRTFFDTISTDMRNALVYNRESSSKKKPEAYTEKTNFHLEQAWLPDSVSFPALINVFGEESMLPELAKVAYYAEEIRPEGKKLIRKEAGIEEGFDEEFAEEENPLEGLEDFLVEGLAFEYAYKELSFGSEEGYDWKDDMEFEDGLPRGVKIVLTLKNKTKNTEENFTQTVFISQGTLGSEIE